MVSEVISIVLRIKVGSDHEQGTLRFNHKISHKEVSLRIYIIKNHTPSAKQPPIIECCLRARRKNAKYRFPPLRTWASPIEQVKCLRASRTDIIFLLVLGGVFFLDSVTFN